MTTCTCDDMQSCEVLQSTTFTFITMLHGWQISFKYYTLFFGTVQKWRHLLLGSLPFPGGNDVPSKSFGLHKLHFDTIDDFNHKHLWTRPACKAWGCEICLPLITFGYLTGPLVTLLSLTQPYLALLGLTRPYSALTLLGLTGLYQALLRLTGPYFALPGLTRPYWALLGFTGPYWSLFCICLTDWLTD